MDSGITQAELLAALQEAFDSEENAAAEGVTREELERATGWGKDKVLKALRLLNAEGRLKVHRRKFADLSGRTNNTVVYVILPQTKRKK